MTITNLEFATGLIIEGVTILNDTNKLKHIPNTVYDFMIYANSLGCYQDNIVVIGFNENTCTISDPSILLVYDIDADEVELSFHFLMLSELSINLTSGAYQLFENIKFKESFYYCPEYKKMFFGQYAKQQFKQQMYASKLLNNLDDDQFHEV